MPFLEAGEAGGSITSGSLVPETEGVLNESNSKSCGGFERPKKSMHLNGSHSPRFVTMDGSDWFNMVQLVLIDCRVRTFLQLQPLQRWCLFKSWASKHAFLGVGSLQTLRPFR